MREYDISPIRPRHKRAICNAIVREHQCWGKEEVEEGRVVGGTLTVGEKEQEKERTGDR